VCLAFLCSQQLNGAEQQPLEVTIAKTTGLIAVDGDGIRDELHVIVTNRSDSEIRISDQWTSSGYQNVTLSVDAGKGAHQLKRCGGEVWISDSRVDVTLLPGEHYVYRIRLCSNCGDGAISNSWGPLSVKQGEYPWIVLKARYVGGFDINGKSTGEIDSKPVRIRLQGGQPQAFPK
jgi:hypothetical protein